MKDTVSDMLFVHRHFKRCDDKLFLFDIKFELADDGFVDFKHIGIHAALEDLRLSSCINKDPNIITEGMYNSAFNMLIEDGVMKSHE